MLLLGICTAVLGWDNVAQFPNALLMNETTQQIVGVQPDKMQNLRGILVLVLGSDSQLVHYISAGIWLLIAGSLYFLWRILTKLDDAGFSILAGASTLTMLFYSPHTHMQDYILAFIPCLMFYFAAETAEDMMPRTRLILKTIAVSFPYISWLFYVYLVELNALKIQPFAIWAVVVAAFAYQVVFKRMLATLKPQDS